MASHENTSNPVPRSREWTPELADLKHALDMSAIVAITDRQGRITYANDNFCSISQYAREELLGKDHRIVNSGFHPKEFFRGLWSTIAGGRVWKGEIRNRAKDGTYYWVDTTIVPVLGPKGSPEEFVSIRYEITERKRLEAEVVRSAQMSLFGELAAALAHEIKNPLAGIQGAVDVMLMRREAIDSERELLENVRKEVSRIDATVRTILERARPQGVDKGIAPINLTVRRAVMLARDHVAAHRARVTFEILSDAGDLALPVDPSQIEAVVLALLTNAIDAVGEDGRISVRVLTRRAGDGQLEEAIIEVEDNGSGIPGNEIDRIFQPFHTTKPHGTGLGLSTAQRIVRAHGGRLEVVSTPGLGSKFSIRLPVTNH